MAENIILNRSNIVSKNNNKLVYEFPRGDAVFGKNAEIAISHFNVFYSWFNITEKYNNNKFSYTWWDEFGDLNQVHNVVIPDGYYSLATLNEFLQTEMVKNGHFLRLKSDGSHVYFIEFVENPTFYSISIRLSSMKLTNMSIDNSSPSTLYGNEPEHLCFTPTGWSAPTGQYECASVIIPSNGKFGDILGFSPGEISATNISQNINSKYPKMNTKIPQLDPSSSFYITCNLVSNGLSNPSNILSAFTIPNGARFGDLISPVNDVLWSKIKEGRYTMVEISIKDQDYRDVHFLDDSMLFVISIKGRDV